MKARGYRKASFATDCCPMLNAPHFVTEECNLYADVRRIVPQMREQEIESTKLYDKVRRLTEQFTEASAALERIHVAADQKDRLAADVRKDLEMARLEAEQILADQVQLEQRVQVGLLPNLSTNVG